MATRGLDTATAYEHRAGVAIESRLAKGGGRAKENEHTTLHGLYARLPQQRLRVGST